MKAIRANRCTCMFAKPGIEAKFWLYPEVRLAYNRGLDARAIKMVRSVIENRRDEIEATWNDFFS